MNSNKMATNIADTSLGKNTTGRSRLSPSLPSSVGVVLGLICNWIWPWPLARYVYVLPVGILFIGLVVVMSVWMSRAFKRHKTTTTTFKETTAIIDTGPFRFSRNPAYVTVAIVQMALGLIFNNVWILLAIIPAMIIVHYVVVLQEEAYLKAKFGDEYLIYKSRVRRWI